LEQGESLAWAARAWNGKRKNVIMAAEPTQARLSNATPAPGSGRRLGYAWASIAVTATSLVWDCLAMFTNHAVPFDAGKQQLIGMTGAFLAIILAAISYCLPGNGRGLLFAALFVSFAALVFAAVMMCSLC
jgi:hypothetical protein